MASIGKELRLRRVVRPDTGRCMLFAASHGTSSNEIFPGLEDAPSVVDAALSGGADCVLISTGLARTCSLVLGSHAEKGYVAKISATAYEDMPRETVISSVERAVRDGADAVGVLMQLSPTNEQSVISLVSDIAEECDGLGMPLIVEAELPGAYGRNSWFPDDVVPYLRRACRLAEELGADVIKTNWPGSPEEYATVIAPVSKPTIVAGGPRVAEEDLLLMVQGAIDAGAAGCSVGRNIFQADDPQQTTGRIAAIVHQSSAVTA